MKKKICLPFLWALTIYSANSIAQNTKLGTNALAHNTTGTFNTAIGYYSLFNNTTGYNNTGVGAQALRSNTTGFWNTANGWNALFSNTTGFYNTAHGAQALHSNTTGYNNTATGPNALQYNTTGYYNTATGAAALQSNTTGSSNTANGVEALSYNTIGGQNTANGFNVLFHNTTGGLNTANGSQALYFNTTGSNNTANGVEALFHNTTGGINTANGYHALYSNTTGYNNTADGVNALSNNTMGIANTAHGAPALSNNTTGSYNTANGVSALSNNTTGSNNTALGFQANVSTGALTNATAIGANAIALASNQVWLGNSAVTSVRAAGGFVIYSDARFKKNIEDNVQGLEFIKQLRPITYNYDIHGLNKHIAGNPTASTTAKNGEAAKADEAAITNKERKRYSGFIAQEVEATAKKLNYDFSGVYKPENDNDVYGLSYAEFVVPLVKAMQEQQKQIEDLKNKADKVDVLEKEVAELKALIMSNPKNNASANLSSAYLEGNTPNPSRGSTIIRYHIPVGNTNATVAITDMKGSLVKSITLNSSGSGQITFDTGSLADGSYNYTLYINGRPVDSKRMLVTR